MIGYCLSSSELYSGREYTIYKIQIEESRDGPILATAFDCHKKNTEIWVEMEK